jgi:hypothetical protein
MDADAIVPWMARGERTWPWWVGFGATTALALTLSVLAYAGVLPPRFFQADKAIHFSIAGLFALFLYRATRARSLWPIGALLVVFALEETAQLLSVHRSASIYDYAADVAGVIAFTTLGWISKTRGAKSADDIAE